MKKSFRILLPILLILILALTVACARQAVTPPVPTPTPVPAPLPPGAKDEGTYFSGNEGPSTIGIDRKIIMTGYISLDVKDVVASMDEISLIAKELGGYVVSSNKYMYEEKIQGEISIRVPAERFEEAFSRLREIAVESSSERTESQDVTEEYVDLQAQLHNLEATEAQYLEILQKAQTVEEILNVYRELSNVRGQIEQIKGRIQYLERTSDMALIQVTLQKAKALTQTGWNALNTFKTAVRGLTSFGRFLADAAIWLLIFCWIWIPLLVLWLTKWRKKPKSS